MIEVYVNLKKEVDNSYPVFIRAGLLDEAAGMIAEWFDRTSFAVVSDSNVAELYAAPLVKNLRDLGCRTSEIITFPAGEQSKTREAKIGIEDRMFSQGLGRDTVVVAVGGGVTGDLAGFAAATYARGVPLVQVPTSLLAMVDSSIGGKTGVDVPWGKNLVGAFHQPSLVLIDPRVLSTLDERQFAAGMAEVVKHAVIRDKDLFTLLEENVGSLTRSSEELLENLISRNCRIKAQVVEQDEREGNLRQILNFGHTVGHALEALSGYRWLHGQAVACGMAVEMEIAAGTGLFTTGGEGLERLVKLLSSLDLPVRIDSLEVSAEKIIEYTSLDKKARERRARYVLPEKIGKMARDEQGAYAMEVDHGIVLEALKSYGAL
ncbi:MAG: 3-dehydroquinate synthase [Gemmatimonadota bacterium]|nr:3-dehydroquinate synthase [Gemmatimonadota bacterium]